MAFNMGGLLDYLPQPYQAQEDNIKYYGANNPFAEDIETYKNEGEEMPIYWDEGYDTPISTYKDGEAVRNTELSTRDFYAPMGYSGIPQYSGGERIDPFEGYQSGQIPSPYEGLKNRAADYWGPYW